MTKITLEHEKGIYSVEVNNIEFFECLLLKVIRPCLIASGYKEDLVDRYIQITDEESLSCYE